MLLGKKEAANVVTITWRVPIGSHSSRYLVPYNMAQDDKEPRSWSCSGPLPLTGQKHLVSVWRGKSGVAHMECGYHSCLTHHVPRSRHFSLPKTQHTGPAAFLRECLACRTRQHHVRNACPAPSRDRRCLVSGYALLLSGGQLSLLVETYPDIGSVTWLWMRSNAGMVSGGRRPNPHSVATPKSATHCCAALMRVSVPSTPSVTWTTPR